MRRPGQKEERYAQTLGEQGEEAPPPPASGPATPPPSGPPPNTAPGLEARLTTLERAVAELRARLDELGG